jgi:hypothetical protein
MQLGNPQRLGNCLGDKDADDVAGDDEEDPEMEQGLPMRSSRRS